MTDQLDMDNRDPNSINKHLKVAFEDVVGEPDGIRSMDCCWSCSFSCFNCCRDGCYNCMTALCACPIAFCWGWEFANLTFAHVWNYTPCLRAWAINCGCAQKFFGTCLQCCLTPVCEAYSLLFSNIVVKNC